MQLASNLDLSMALATMTEFADSPRLVPTLGSRNVIAVRLLARAGYPR